MIYRNIGKRSLDIMLSFIGLMVFSPLFLLLMVILAISNSGYPFFTQLRPGKHGKIFKIIKFRTMNNKVDEEGRLLPNKDRITPLGSLIRKSSLDEIPQLINVLIGDMSLIGPRPLLIDYLPLYNSFQMRRHEVKPGITGWAQVNGRNAISWDEKFEYDIWYVDHLSFIQDIRIMFLTILKVVRSEGISVSSEVTMERFTGNLS